MASENGVEAEGTQENDYDTENDSRETESSSPETSTALHSKSPCELCENSNVYWTLIMKCPKCFWQDNYKICPICDHQIPEGRNYIKEGFRRCHDFLSLFFIKVFKTVPLVWFYCRQLLVAFFN